MRRATALISILAMVSMLSIGPIPPATAQTNSDGCPEGMECHGPNPEVCVSANNLEEHQQNLADCRNDRRRLEGRLEEARDAEASAKARAENMAVKASKQAERAAIWKGRAEHRADQLDRWYRKPLPWIGISIGVGIVGYGIGAMAPPSFLD